MFDESKVPYGATVAQARYSGVYEGGRWLAFPAFPDSVDNKFPGWDGSDLEALEFWGNPDSGQALVGRGNTPNDAVMDMTARMEENNE